MAKRRMSAKQRRYFGGTRRIAKRARTVYRSRAKVYKRAGRSSFGGILPTPVQASLVNFGAGVTMPIVSSFVAPYTDGILAPLGSYKDEARTALIGMALSFIGTGVVKQVGKSYFDFAVTSAGVQTGVNFSGTNGMGNTAGGAYL